MNNLIILVGKVESISKENNSFILRVNRPIKNKQNNIESDLFICKTWKGMFSYITTYINKEDTVLIKGKLFREKEDFVVKIDEFSLIQRSQKKISA